MRESKPAIIDIILDGKLFGMRIWRNVPRAGDTLLLEGGNHFAQVRRVIWGEDGSGDYDCWVQLLCDTVKDIKATGKSKKKSRNPTQPQRKPTP